MRGAGHRRTRPRTLILAVLAEADGHLTADAVRERAVATSGMDPSTVYRTLALFERLQIVHTLTIGKRVTYGLADHPHAHTVCDGCARVTALRDAELGDLRTLVRRDLAGFAATGIVIRGRCAACRPAPDD
ncbi:transcriptional repressor [Actinomadura meridiana]|uniref:Transcriptional repressor n=1 Tax=Actinomadura meridiana TaxID=559626 RepID=A0ABP8C3N2_9ACTN